MRMMRFLIVAVFLVALLVYVVWHVWRLAPLPAWGKWTLAALMIACFAMEFVAFMPIMGRLPLAVASAVYNVGNKTLIVMLYLLLAFLLLDLGRLLHLLPRNLLCDNVPVTVVLTLLIASLCIYGSIHYRHKQRVELALDSGGRLEQPLRVVMASDLHVGYHNRRAEVERWVRLINAERPDVVLFAGDIVDFSMRPLLEEDVAAAFRGIEAPVYACLGNHEYFAGGQEVLQFYRDAGINLLRDSVVTFRGLTLIGLDDRSNPTRKALATLAPRDGAYTIVMDHQPYHLDEAERCGIDFQLSGHTHDGQVWPLSWLVRSMYECAWGSHRRGKTNYYVTSGLGIWGATYRIGTQSEYVVATIK